MSFAVGWNATLKDAELACPHCGTSSTQDWQFHYGACGDFPIYRIGDCIAWQVEPCLNQEYPFDDLFAVGHSDPCPQCEANFVALVVIKEGRITGIEIYKPVAFAPEQILDKDRAVCSAN